VASKKLPVDPKHQEQTKWCWATTVQMGLSYLAKQNVSQCDIVKVGKGKDTCPNEGGNVTEQMTAYKHWGMDGAGIYQSLTFKEIVSEIEGDKPFSAGWYYKVGMGHDVLVEGFDDAPDGWVWYLDPWDEKPVPHKTSYTWFKGGTGPGDDHRWGDTIHNLHTTAVRILRDVHEAALAGLNALMEEARNEPVFLGLPAGGSADNAVLGSAYQLRYVDPERLAKATDSTRLTELADPVDVYLFTVSLDAVNHWYLTVARVGDRYAAVEFGGDASPFVTALATLRQRIDSEQECIVVKAGRVYYPVSMAAGKELAVAAMAPGRSAISGGMDATVAVESAEVTRFLRGLHAEARVGDKA